MSDVATAFNLNAWLESTRKPLNATSVFGLDYLDIRPRIQCADGFSISVQADSAKYCSPRESVGPYLEVECGFPMQGKDEVASIDGWDEYGGHPVWGYVPVSLVEELIASHGGITP